MYRPSARAAVAAAIALATITLFATTSHASTITVNSLADDVFPDGAGLIFDANGLPVILVTPKCTLRMAIAAANLDLPVGGGSGCATGSGVDNIVFDAALNLGVTPGTIMLANKLMSEAPAVFVPPNASSVLVASTPMSIIGPGSAQLSIDGSAPGVEGRRILVSSNGNQDTDAPFNLSGLRLLRGRAVDTSAGCLFAGESVTINDVIFEGCESVGGPAALGFGGAMGAGNQLAGSVLPTVTITNAKFLGNRSLRGTSLSRPEVGGLFIGSDTRKVGAVTLTNVLFNGNSSEYRGAMAIQNAGSVVISGSHFIGNAATGIATASVSNGRYGGFHIVGVSGNVDINNATRVNGNVANEERAGFSIQSIGGTVTIDAVDVSGNYANRHRIGGFEVLTDTFDANGNCTGTQLRPVNISNARIQGNSVASVTGGFRVGCSGAVTLTDVVIADNETRGYRLAPADVVSTGNSAAQFFSSNDASAPASTLTMTRVTIRNNQTNATAGGGGFGVVNIDGLGAFTANSLRFIDNYAEQNEGISLRARGAGRNYVIANSEFSGNNASGISALFIETDGNYTLRNSTVSGNRAGGGSIVKVNANTNTPQGIIVAIEHSTLARNIASFEEAFGVGVWANQPNPSASFALHGGANAAISVKNSILGTRSPGFNAASAVFFDSANGVTNVVANNTLLEWTGGAPANFCSFTGMKCNVGSLVLPLADNGGGNGLRTMALMAGSPAINAGGAVLGGLTTDERGTGFPRVIGGIVDMGAFESDPATIVGCTLDIDGNGDLDALTDGLLLIRALFQLTGAPATNGALGGGATRNTWAAIRNYLNANCGSSLAQ